MSQAEIERFVADARQDDQLLTELTDGSLALGAFVEKARKRGYDFDLHEARAYLRTHHAPEASDEELSHVAGGTAVVIWPGPSGDPGLETVVVDTASVVASTVVVA